MSWIREDDEVVYGDFGYSGAGKQEEICNDEPLSKVEFRTNRRPSSIKVSASCKGINWDKQMENRRSSTHCKVDHPFLIVKKQFGYAKVVYRGIAKHEPLPYPVRQRKSVTCARVGGAGVSAGHKCAHF